MSRRTRVHRYATGLVGLVLATAVASCGLGTASGVVPSAQLAGELSSVESLDGATIKVGSKNFTEQLIVGKILAIMLKSAGADVQDLTNIPGSVAARQAQLVDQIDIEYEYTGTAWIIYLGHANPIPDEQKQYEAVRDEDAQANDLEWLPPAPMNNTYGFAANAEVAKKLGVETLSDMFKLPSSDLTFCVENEFANRADGFKPVVEAYGVDYGSLKSGQVKTFDTGAVYAAVDGGECNFGEIFTTDGRIKALDLTVMEDDKEFFPKYNLSPVVRKEILDAYPQIADLLNPINEKLTDETLIELNGKVDVDGQKPVDVAMDWLKSEGFLT